MHQRTTVRRFRHPPPPHHRDALLWELQFDEALHSGVQALFYVHDSFQPATQTFIYIVLTSLRRWYDRHTLDSHLQYSHPPIRGKLIGIPKNPAPTGVSLPHFSQKCHNDLFPMRPCSNLHSVTCPWPCRNVARQHDSPLARLSAPTSLSAARTLTLVAWTLPSGIGKRAHWLASFPVVDAQVPTLARALIRCTRSSGFWGAMTTGGASALCFGIFSTSKGGGGALKLRGCTPWVGRVG